MSPRAKTALAFGIVVLAGAALVGVAFKARSDSQPSQLRIGVIQPLTGPLAVAGLRAYEGIQLAVAEHNAQSAVHIALAVEDSKGDPTEGVRAANKLISADGVRFILGDLTSGVTLAFAPIAEQQHVLVLAPGASSPNLRDAGDYIFRNWVSDDFDGMVAAQYLVTRLGRKRAAIVYVNNEYGIGLLKSFKARFEALGGTVVTEDAFQPGQTDLRALAARLAAQQFDVVYLAGQPRESAFLLRQMAEIGFRPFVFSNVSVEESDFLTIAADAARGVHYTAPDFDLDSPRPAVASFVAEYRARFGKDPDVVSAHGYDAAKMLIDCIQAGSPTDAVKECLYNTQGFDGVTGRTSFDRFGDAIKGVVIKRVDTAGRRVDIEEFAPAAR